MAGMRDRLIHGYLRVDYDIGWDVITTKVPGVQREVEQIVRNESTGQGPTAVRSGRRFSPAWGTGSEGNPMAVHAKERLLVLLREHHRHSAQVGRPAITGSAVTTMLKGRPEVAHCVRRPEADLGQGEI